MGLAGTQTLDHEWSLIKSELPHNKSCKTDATRELLDEHWRAAQWRRLVNTTDIWGDFARMHNDTDNKKSLERS